MQEENYTIDVNSLNAAELDELYSAVSKNSANPQFEYSQIVVNPLFGDSASVTLEQN